MPGEEDLSLSLWECLISAEVKTDLSRPEAGQEDRTGGTEGGRDSALLLLLVITSALTMVDHLLDGLGSGLRPRVMLIFSDWSLIWSLILFLQSTVTELLLACSLHLLLITAGFTAGKTRNIDLVEKYILSYSYYIPSVSHQLLLLFSLQFQCK